MRAAACRSDDSGRKAEVEHQSHGNHHCLGICQKYHQSRSLTSLRCFIFTRAIIWGRCASDFRGNSYAQVWLISKLDLATGRTHETRLSFIWSCWTLIARNSSYHVSVPAVAVASSAMRGRQVCMCCCQRKTGTQAWSRREKFVRAVWRDQAKMELLSSGWRWFILLLCVSFCREY